MPRETDSTHKAKRQNSQEREQDYYNQPYDGREYYNQNPWQNENSSSQNQSWGETQSTHRGQQASWGDNTSPWGQDYGEESRTGQKKYSPFQENNGEDSYWYNGANQNSYQQYSDNRDVYNYDWDRDYKKEPDNNKKKKKESSRLPIIIAVVAVVVTAAVVGFAAIRIHQMKEDESIEILDETQETSQAEAEATPEPAQEEAEATPEPTQEEAEATPEPTQEEAEATPEPTQEEAEATPEPTQETETSQASDASQPVTATLILDDIIDPSSAGYTMVQVDESTADASSIKHQQSGKINYARYAFDNDMTTSWQEDVSGYGIGQTLSVQFDTQEVQYISFRLGNWNGGYYDENGRPKTILLKIGTFSGELTFPDKQENFWVQFSQPMQANAIYIEIRDAYAGSKYEDNCISDVVMYN